MRTRLVTAIETEAQKRVAEQLAELESPVLDERESALVTLAIRAGIGAAFAAITDRKIKGDVMFPAEGKHG